MATNTHEMMQSQISHVSWDENYTKYFAAQVLRGLPKNASILDAGCGKKLHPFYRIFRERAAYYSGCDPDPEASNNSDLDEFFPGTIETAAFGDTTFDAVVASYVLEHLEYPETFFANVASILKPGGRLIFLTPNRRHPFCSCVRCVEWLNLKSRLHRHYGKSSATDWRINNYPAYYRANSVARVESLAANAGFDRATFSLVAGGWSHYFPRILRFIPSLYDRVLADRLPQGSLILIGDLALKPSTSNEVEGPEPVLPASEDAEVAENKE